jgi:hypothetical protein
MKPRTLNPCRLSLPLATALSALLAVPSIHAQSLSGTTNGAWLTTTNWTGGVPAGSSTDPANTNIAVFNVPEPQMERIARIVRIRDNSPSGEMSSVHQLY